MEVAPVEHAVVSSLSSTDVGSVGDNAVAKQVSKNVVSIADVDSADAKQIDKTVEESSSIERVAHEERQGLQRAGGLHEPVAWAELRFAGREREQRPAGRFFVNAAPLSDHAVRGTEEAHSQSSGGSGPDSDSDDDADNLQDGGDEDWISFLTDSDVGSLLAASWRLSAVAAVHVTHLAREDLSTERG
jgi:hypothetical protein